MAGFNRRIIVPPSTILILFCCDSGIGQELLELKEEVTNLKNVIKQTNCELIRTIDLTKLFTDNTNYKKVLEKRL